MSINITAYSCITTVPDYVAVPNVLMLFRQQSLIHSLTQNMLWTNPNIIIPWYALENCNATIRLC